MKVCRTLFLQILQYLKYEITTHTTLFTTHIRRAATSYDFGFNPRLPGHTTYTTHTTPWRVKGKIHMLHMRP